MSEEIPKGYEEALQHVLDEQKVSVSGIQRHLKISYNEAAKIIALLEARGIISPLTEGNKRTVLIAEMAELADDGPGEPLPEVTDENAGDLKTSDGWDAEGDHDAALLQIEDDSDLDSISTDQMVFDMRDAMLARVKGMTQPWSGCSQSQQREIAAAFEEAAEKMVQRAVEAIVARGVDPVRILLTKVALGNEIIITGKVRADDPEDEFQAVKTLHHALNKFVMLTVANSDEFNQGSREAETDLDDPPLPFESGADMDDEPDAEPEYDDDDDQEDDQDLADAGADVEGPTD